MNSRERVLTALRHEEADRIPIDFGAMRSTGIAAAAYQDLKAYLGLGTETRVYDLFQWLAEPDPEVARIMGADVIQLHRLRPSFDIPLRDWKRWRAPNGRKYLVPGEFNPTMQPDGMLEMRDPDEPSRVVAIMPAGGYYFDSVYHPLENVHTYAEIDAYKFPVLDDEELEYLTREARRLSEETDYAILGEFGGNILEFGQGAFGYQRFMEMLGLEPDLVHYFLEKVADGWIEQLRRYLPAVKDYIHIIQVGDDLGTQENLQLSPRMYRELIKPYHKRIYRFIKE
ncbi:MAG TPA: methyltransferase, partial [Anaerolineae bacterium]|nr:methyltransferase [Anaerolineae bacterium]